MQRGKMGTRKKEDGETGKFLMQLGQFLILSWKRLNMIASKADRRKTDPEARNKGPSG